MTAAVVAPGTAELLTLQNVVKSYGTQPKQFVAVRDISMEIRAGEFF